MEKTLPKIKEKQKIIKHYIPDELVYEIMNEKPIYYKGYKEVINDKKQIQDIMGSSSLQSWLIRVIVKYLDKNIDDNKYDFLFSELGLHINKKNNLAADIAIFEKDKILNMSKQLQK